MGNHGLHGLHGLHGRDGNCLGGWQRHGRSLREEARLLSMIISIVVLIASYGVVRAADVANGWLCIADEATGFVYDKYTKSWAAKNGVLTDDKFVVRKPTIGDIESLRRFHLDTASASYVVLQVGQSLPPIICSNPPGAENDLMICESGLRNFSMNSRLLRMQFYYGVGYLHQDFKFSETAVDNPDSPLIAIGKCSPL